MELEDLENVKAVKLTFTNQNGDYTPPAPIRVAELAEVLVTALRDFSGGCVKASLLDEKGSRRFSVCMFEYEDPEDNEILWEILNSSSDAISDNRKIRLEIR